MSNWNITEIDNKLYLIKYENNKNNIFKCILSDVGSIWEEQLSANDLLARAKDINPVVEIELENLVKNIFQPSADMRIEDVGEDGRKFSIKFKLDDYTLKFNWNLKKCIGNDQSGPNDLMVSLVCSLIKLKTQNNSLIKLIKKKDEEIEQHKFDGVTLTREKLITPKFDDQKFLESTRDLHSRSHEFDDILGDSAHIRNLIKLCDVDMAIDPPTLPIEINRDSTVPQQTTEAKKNMYTLKKRKEAQKKHLPNRGALNYDMNADSSDDGDDEGSSNNKRDAYLIPKLENSNKPKRKHVPF